MSTTQMAVVFPLDPSPIRHPKLDDIKTHPRPRYRGHWAMLTNHLEKSDAFYRALSGAELICVPRPGTVATSWDSEHHRFFVAHIAALRPPTAPVNETIPVGERLGDAGGCVRFASPTALTGVYQRMRAQGFEPLRILERERSVSLFYKNPDGYLVETTAPKAAVSQQQGELSAENFLSRFAIAR